MAWTVDWYNGWRVQDVNGGMHPEHDGASIRSRRNAGDGIEVSKYDGWM